MKRLVVTIFTLFLIHNMVCAHTQNHQEEHKEKRVKNSLFDDWVRDTIEKKESKSHVIQTRNGPVEYVLKGKGPVVLSLHGGFGGWDQGLLIANHVIDEHFAVLAPSRPGYFRTLLPTDPFVHHEFTPAQQAVVIIALLDALNIKRVAVIGFSAGAPVAFALAQNYPDRVSGVVLESIGANPSEDFVYSNSIINVLSNPTLPDYFSYLLYLSTENDFYSTLKVAVGLDTTLKGDKLDDRIHIVTAHKSQYKFLKKFILASIPISPRFLGILNDFLGANYWTTVFNPAGYSTPTLIVQSPNDSNGFYPIAQVVQSKLPNSELITIPESGHLIWLGPETKKWEKIVTKFLRDHSPK